MVAAELREVGAGIALAANALRGLRLLGLASELEAVVPVPIDENIISIR